MGYSINQQVTSANLPAKHLIYKLWIFSERSTQTTHVDVSAFYSFRHTMATPPTTSSSNNSPRLAVSPPDVGTSLVSDNVASPYGRDATGDNPLYPKAGTPVGIYRILSTKGTITVPENTIWTYNPETADRYNEEAGWKAPMVRITLPVAQGNPFQQQAEHLARVV